MRKEETLGYYGYLEGGAESGKAHREDAAGKATTDRATDEAETKFLNPVNRDARMIRLGDLADTSQSREGSIFVPRRRDSSDGKSAGFITLRSRVRLPLSPLMSRKAELERFLSEADRRVLLILAREAREKKLLSPLYPLSHYDTMGLRRLLRRLGNSLWELPYVRAHLGLPKEAPPPPTEDTYPPAISLAELREKLFPGLYGMEVEKEFLIEHLYLPLHYPVLARKYGLSVSPMIIVEGPPGSGKSYLFRTLSKGGQLPTRFIHTPALASMWFGESERRLRHIFQKAFRQAPMVLVFEEFDSLFPARETNLPWLNGMTNQLLLLVDELKHRHKPVAVVGLTNRCHAIEGALLRSERIDHRLYISLPDGWERELILRQASQNFPVEPDIDWAAWAEKLEGYSRADLLSWLRRAAKIAFLRDRFHGQPQKISSTDLQRALHE